MNIPVFPALYLPPVPYFQLLARQPGQVLIEQHEHFPKQTYRNRATIYGANGALDLIVPVKKGKHVHTRMQDVEIAYEEDWQRLHWMSLQSAYRRSAYFEFYEEEFELLYNQRFSRLLDFNIAQLHLIVKLLRLNIRFELTESYREDYVQDFRSAIHPKKSSPLGEQRPYYQLFADRHGFLADLSVVDLLFNRGPQSVEFLIFET